jgi:hypothetical protein
MTLALMIDAPGNQFGILARHWDHKGNTRRSSGARLIEQGIRKVMQAAGLK